jgi:Lar family restriction alleviation protein
MSKETKLDETTETPTRSVQNDDAVILPCPFCGGKAKLCSNTDDTQGRDWHEIYCFSCGAGVETQLNKSKVIAAWNKRTV